MARPFCCAKAFDTTSLRPVAPLRRSAWADQRAPAALPDTCNKNPPSFIPCNAAISYALPSRRSRDGLSVPSCRPSAAYCDDPPPLNSRCTKKHFLYPPAVYRGNKSNHTSAAHRAKPFLPRIKKTYSCRPPYSSLKKCFT